jgi:hypothetical protein
MAKVYKSAMGKQIDVDSILLTNEHVIAVGNMKTNGRGDLLGPGGKVAKTRDQLMKEYYSLNTPIASDVNDQIPNATTVAKTTSSSSQQHPAKQSTTSPSQAGTAPLVFSPAPIINPASGLDEIEPEIVKSQPAVATQPRVQSQPPTMIAADVYEPEIPAPVPAADQTPMIPVMPGPGTPSEVVPVVHHDHISEPGMPMAPATIIRGKMANALAAKPATVTQKEMLPPKKANGVQRF